MRNQHLHHGGWWSKRQPDDDDDDDDDIIDLCVENNDSFISVKDTSSKRHDDERCWYEKV